MENDMTIYKKLAEAREAFHNMDLKKTGLNKFAGYKYFELSDFLVPGMKCMKAAGLVPVVTFEFDRAVMTIHDLDGKDTITISSPMADANLKGCHPIQNLGAVQTYQRRYLWVCALEIVEHDAVDASGPVEDAVIDDGQVADIVGLMDELGDGLDRDKFTAWLKQKGVKDGNVKFIKQSQFKDVLAMLERKRQS
jgi:hypothetical protein